MKRKVRLFKRTARIEWARMDALLTADQKTGAVMTLVYCGVALLWAAVTF